MSEVMSVHDDLAVEARFAAGLLAGDGSLLASTNVDRLTIELTELGEICATSGPGGANTAPNWAAPDLDLVAELAPQLQTAWARVASKLSDRQLLVLHVKVWTAADALQLARCSDIAPLRVVASVPTQPDLNIDLDGAGIRVERWREPDDVVTRGGGPVMDVDLPMALPPERPPQAGDELAADADADATRQLLAHMSRDGDVCERVLEPRKEHDLAVRIAIPRRGEQGVPFDEDAIDFGDDGVADLVVDVTSDDGSFHGTAPLKLSEDRARASTVAGFKVTAGDEGSVLQLNITVLFENRPIRACQLVASARATPLPDDVIQLWAVPLSAAPEPSPITRADVALEDNGLNLSVRGADEAASLPLDDAENWSAAFEQVASQVLGNDFAPSAIDDPEAVRLLIQLARRGSRFADRLNGRLGLRGTHTISVLVRHDEPVLPLELAYDGPAPRETAKLCGCVRDGSPRGGRCTRAASARRVCPDAFWGMNRVIARTIRFPRVPNAEPRPPLGELTLRPVVYAAADRADTGSSPASLPSGALAAVLTQHAGASHFTQVRSWRAWRSAVEESKPQLLVVLGHTEAAEAEVSIEIGERSVLRQPEIEAHDVGALSTPAPVVLLFACDSAVSGDVFGALPGTFIDRGAAAVVATLTKFKGRHAAEACAAVASALYEGAPVDGLTLGTALTRARRELVARGLLVGLLLVAVGEIDLRLSP